MTFEDYKKEIPGLVENLYKFYRISSFPIDVKALTTLLGGHYEEAAVLPDNAVWRAEKHGKEPFIVKVRDNITPDVKRMAAAEALGFSIFRYNTSADISEQLAPFFSAELLMPRPVYASLANQYRQGNTIYVQPIAQFFGVPVAAAHIRGQALGIFH